jgi:hypothetical protein
MSEAIEGARDFQGFMDRIAADEKRLAQQARSDRGESVQGNPAPLGIERLPGENRAEHRARLKRQRREAKAGKVSA